MKKLLPFILVIFIFPGGQAVENIIPSEFFIHSSASLFGKTTEVHKLVDSADYLINRILPYKEKNKILKQKEIFKVRTGIDLLNVQSLTEAGLDVNGKISSAYFMKSEMFSTNSLLIFIPVLKPEEFKDKFVEIIKSLSSNKELNEKKPIIEEYGENKIYQLSENFFYSTIDKYLIVSHRAEVLKKAFDLQDKYIKTDVVKEEASGVNETDEKKADKESPDGGEDKDENPEEKIDESLAADELFKSYIDKKKNKLDINVFIRKDFLETLLVPVLNKTIKGAALDESEVSNHFQIVETGSGDDSKLMAAAEKEIKRKSSPQKTNKNVQSFSRFLKFIDYGSVGIGFDSDIFKANLLFNFIAEDPTAETFLKLFKPGNYNSALVFDKSQLFGLLSINPLIYETPAGREIPGYSIYRRIKYIAKSNMGFDLSRDLLPHHEGVVNGVLLKPKVMTYIGDYAIFLAMNNEKKSDLLFIKMKKFFQKRYARTKGFGVQKVEKGNSFWFVDRKKKKIFIYTNGSGLYFGNDIKLIESFAGSKKFSDTDSSHHLLKKMNDDLFLIVHLKKNSFLMQVLKRFAPHRAKGILSRFGDLFIEGEKIDKSISIGLDIEMKIKRNKKEVK